AGEEGRQAGLAPFLIAFEGRRSNSFDGRCLAVAGLDRGEFRAFRSFRPFRTLGTRRALRTGRALGARRARLEARLAALGELDRGLLAHLGALLVALAA